MYTSDDTVAALAAQICAVFVVNMWLVALSNVCMGICSGCGRQPVNAQVGLLSSYGFGLPTALLYCFVFDLGLIGLWLGLVTGSLMRAICMYYLTFFGKVGSDWEALSRAARQRAAK